MICFRLFLLSWKLDVLTRRFSMVRSFYKKSFDNDAGVGMVEYALLVALLAVIGIASMRTLGVEISDNADEVKDYIAGGGDFPPEEFEG
jgi:Flp pilus assembly pilin Flp